jgi:hypothetical protein
VSAAKDYASLLDLPMSTTERVAIEAPVVHGSQNVAADAIGWKRSKLQSRLRAVQARAAAAPPGDEPPPVHGAVAARAANPAPVAPGARVARYILTAAQNNTLVHTPFLANLEAYAAAMGATIMVSRFSYNKATYGAKATKAGRAPGAADTEGLWYDPAIAHYVCDDPARHGSCRWQLAPASADGDGGLVWCAEMNILPTAVRPLSGLESYSGPASGVFPHAKICLESVPVIGERPPKFNYTTGAVTQRNYVAKKEGIKAEFHHAYGALFVEADLVSGMWWARQLNATDDGAFYDLTRRVANGRVTLGHRLLAFNPGDVHASEIDPTTRTCIWGRGGALDILRPEHQFWHDTFSHRNRSHHELKSFEARYAKWAAGDAADSVEHEVRVAAELLAEAHRDWCTTVVVSSNHDRHIDRWLDEADYKQDPANAEFFLEAQLERARIIRALGPRQWDGLRWAIERQWRLANALWPVRFLGRDESFRIGPPGHEIECGSHGDEGPNGARGNASNLSRIPIRMNVGHAHSACLREGLAQAGVCHRPKQSSYAHGASSWSTSHILTYQNGKRCIATERGGRLWL